MVETSNTVSELTKFYQEIRFSAGIDGNTEIIKSQIQSNYKIGHGTVNGITASQLISEISPYEQTVHIDVLCVGASYTLWNLLN